MNENSGVPSREDNWRSNPQSARPSGIDANQEILDVGFLLGALWRGKFRILALTFFLIILGGYYSYIVAVPYFRASSVVMLETRQEQVVDLESVVGGLSMDSSVVNTEVEILKSRTLIGRVVDQLNLTADPEFNLQLQDPPLIDQLKEVTKSFLGMSTTSLPLSEEEQRERERAGTVTQLRQVMRVRNVPQSLVFDITVETTSARKSAQIANTLADQYILDQLAVKFAATEKATAWLADRVTELQAQLEQSEAQMKEFRGNIDVISPEALAAFERQLKEIRNRLADNFTNREALDARLNALRAAQTPEEKVVASEDPRLERLLPRLDDPEIRKSFDTRYTQVVSRTEAEIASGESQFVALTASAAEMESQITQQSNDLITLQQLEREAEATRLLYEHFLTRLKETSAQEGIQQPDSRLLSVAEVPLTAAVPRTSLILALCGLFGMLLGSAWVILREIRNNTFREAGALESMTGYPVIGQIPLLPRNRRKNVATYLADKPHSAASETIRNLRTSIQLSNLDHPPKVLLLSSSLPGEGKTTVSLALAHNLASLGKRVLLIEGDTRRRVLTGYLEQEVNDGLMSVLIDDTPLEEAIYHDDLLGIEILPSGKNPSNAADKFGSQKFANLMKQLRATYDYIVIDTPPVLVVTDARLIAQYADSVLFVVRWDSTLKTQVQDGLRMFEDTQHPASGVVLNQINPRGIKRYGYGGSYGVYSNYGSNYYTN